MTRDRRFLLLLLGVLLSIVTMLPAAAVDANATSSAIINSTIQLYKITDLNFGTIVPSAALGTVTLAPSASYGSDGGMVLVNGTPRTAAAFWVYGQLNRTFSIAISESTTIEHDGNTMTVNTFIADVSPSTNMPGATTGTLYTPTDLAMCPLHIGAKLHVGINQPFGIYTGTFQVTVAY